MLRKNTGPPRHNWYGAITLCTAVLALLSGVILFVVRDLPLLGEYGENRPTATVLAPEGTAVGHQTMLSGTVMNTPEGTTVWAVTQDPSNNRYYPQDRECATEGGEFNCGAYYVGPKSGGAGQEFRILVVTVTAQAASAFQRYQFDKGPNSNPGMAELPPGVSIIGHKDVVRK